MSKLLICCVVATAIMTGFACAQSTADENRRIVAQFYDLAFRQHQPAEAAKRYLGTTYKQHNPRVPDGPDVFAQFFEGFLKQNPTASSEVKRVIAENDLVMLHSHSKQSPDDRGRAIVDIFRVEGGKIVEHWDVIQAVPETSANKNSMF